MPDVNKIKSQNWSLSTAKQGEIVQDIDDINQCISVILETIKGSDPLRPDFGSDVFLWLDKPIGLAGPNIIAEAIKSIRLWEKRCNVVKAGIVVDENIITLSVEWQPINSLFIQSTKIQYNSAA